MIKGEKKQEKDFKKEDFVRLERSYGAFYRAITLPEGVDANNVKASYKNGVLDVTVPKKEEAKAKHISIEVK